jgi:hypothetical protein
MSSRSLDRERTFYFIANIGIYLKYIYLYYYYSTTSCLYKDLFLFLLEFVFFLLLPRKKEK